MIHLEQYAVFYYLKIIPLILITSGLFVLVIFMFFPLYNKLYSATMTESERKENCNMKTLKNTPFQGVKARFSGLLYRVYQSRNLRSALCFREYDKISCRKYP